MTDKKAHTYKNNGNLSIRNQVGNLFNLNFLVIWIILKKLFHRTKTQLNKVATKTI